MKGFCPRYDMWVMSYFGHIANILNIPSICQNKGFSCPDVTPSLFSSPIGLIFCIVISNCGLNISRESDSCHCQTQYFIEVNGEICLLNVTLKEEKLDTRHFLLVQFSLLFCLKIFILTYFCQNDSCKSNLLDTCPKMNEVFLQERALYRGQI